MSSFFRELKQRKDYRVVLGSDLRFEALVFSPEDGSTR